MNKRSTRFERLERGVLYVLVDAQLPPPLWERRIESLIEAGVDILQLRDKRLSDRQLLWFARRLRQLTRDTSTLFIVNDRCDIALLAEADGVHLGQDELSSEDARALLGCEALVGISTHSLNQARQAVGAGADYIGVGPVFPSTTKSFEAYPGLQLIREVAAEVRLPAFAIGGISAENLSLVLGSGTFRVAVGAAICGSGDPAAAATHLKQLLCGRAAAAGSHPSCLVNTPPTRQPGSTG